MRISGPVDGSAASAIFCTASRMTVCSGFNEGAPNKRRKFSPMLPVEL